MKIYGSLGFLMGFCLTSIAANWRQDPTAFLRLPRPKKVVIDTDAGGDDASAILLALMVEKLMPSSSFEVVAITCTYGNTKVSNVGSNVLKILTIGNRSDIPVYIGAHKPLLQNYTMDYHFGDDGLGDIDFNEEIVGVIDRSKHASIALVDLAREHPGELSIIALGPLTNLAVAITLDRSFLSNVNRIYIMGSSVHGLGNIAPAVEFNFYQDPESNFIVLNGTTIRPVILLPWETAVSASISTKWRTDVLGTIDSRIMNFLNRVESKTLTQPTWIPADLITTALALWPELITRTILTNVSPVFDGAAKGSVLVDYVAKTGKTQNAEILDAFNVERFQQLLLLAFA